MEGSRPALRVPSDGVAMRLRGETPVCPRHPGSTVWRDGTYGPSDRRRQRYRCVPADGSAPHRFTEPLAQTAVQFSYNAAEIAATLVGVGRGMSYRAAARLVARTRPPDGNSVADWVELFAPLIYARYAPRRWPRVVALDVLRFRARTRDARGRPLPEEVPAFRVLGALAYDRGAAAQVLTLRAVPGDWPRGGQRFWEELLRALEGAPAEVVCIPDPDLLAAIDAVWLRPEDGGPSVFLSQSHLQRDLLDLLLAEGVSPEEELFAAATRAFASPAGWHAFGRMRHRRVRALERWFRRYGDHVAWQLANRRGHVTDTTELEQRLASLHDQLAGRRGTIANRERTNRLLMLAQLEMNGDTDESAYAAILEEEIRARGGRAGRRREIVDRTGSSLRP